MVVDSQCPQKYRSMCSITHQCPRTSGYLVYEYLPHGRGATLLNQLAEIKPASYLCPGTRLPGYPGYQLLGYPAGSTCRPHPGTRVAIIGRVLTLVGGNAYARTTANGLGSRTLPKKKQISIGLKKNHECVQLYSFTHMIHTYRTHQQRNSTNIY